MVPGLRDNRTGKLDHGEKRRARWPQLKSAALKCGGKSPIMLMRRSRPNCAREWKRTSKPAPIVLRYWTGPEMSLGWSPMEGCFRCPRGSTSGYIKRFRTFRNLMLRVVESAPAGMGLRHLGYPCTSITSTFPLYFCARYPHNDPGDGLVDHRL